MTVDKMLVTLRKFKNEMTNDELAMVEIMENLVRTENEIKKNYVEIVRMVRKYEKLDDDAGPGASKKRRNVNANVH